MLLLMHFCTTGRYQWEILEYYRGNNEYWGWEHLQFEGFFHPKSEDLAEKTAGLKKGNIKIGGKSGLERKI